MLPRTALADKYAPQRGQLTGHAKIQVKLEKQLRNGMDWVKSMRTLAAEDPLHRPSSRPGTPAAAEGGAGAPSVAVSLSPRPGAGVALDTRVATPGASTPVRVPTAPPDGHDGYASLLETLTRVGVSDDVLSLLKVEGVTKLVALLARDAALGSRWGRHPHPSHAAARAELEDAVELIERLLEGMGEGLLSRIVGMRPKPIPSFTAYVGRLIDSIQNTNDERVQTKPNYSRTCFLNTEYVGVADFKLEDGDLDFLWRKGYASTLLWLEMRVEKRRAKKAAEKAAKAAKEGKEVKKKEEAPPPNGPPQVREADVGMQVALAATKWLNKTFKVVEKKKAAREGGRSALDLLSHPPPPMPPRCSVASSSGSLGGSAYSLCSEPSLSDMTSPSSEIASPSGAGAIPPKPTPTSARKDTPGALVGVDDDDGDAEDEDDEDDDDEEEEVSGETEKAGDDKAESELRAQIANVFADPQLSGADEKLQAIGLILAGVEPEADEGGGRLSVYQNAYI